MEDRTVTGVVRCVLCAGLVAALALSGSGAALADPPPASTSVTSQIRKQQIAAEAVSERLDDAKTSLGLLTGRQSEASADLDTATRNLDAARDAVSSWARNSYIDAAGRPSGLPTNPRNEMFGHTGVRADTVHEALEVAEARHKVAAGELSDLDAQVAAQQASVDKLQSDLKARGAALAKLRTPHATAIAAAQKEQDSVDAAMASKYIRDAQGSAGAAAIKAVAFALAQRGKPYEWGAEGPDLYDCSGLVQTAYAKAGITLPRTARPQFRATKVVPITALLPGDLLFFATDKNDWNTIHHVAIYLGHGMMLHAPTTGDVVRVAPVWWSEFYAATRVVPGSAKPAPVTKPIPAPSKSPTPSKTPTPSPSASSPSPSPSSPSPSSPSPSSPSPSPSSPSPSPSSPSPSSPSSSVSPTATKAPTPSGSPSTAGGPTPSKTPTPSASPTKSASPAESATSTS